MADYTSQAKIEAFLKRPLSDHEVVSLETAIPAVMSYIDVFCGRTFNTTANTTHYYDGNGEHELFIEDWASIDSISSVDKDQAVITTLVENDDYVLYPLNSTFVNSVLRTGGNHWPTGLKNIRIVGSIGQSTIPDSISIVASVLVGRLLQNPNNLKSRSIEGYSEVYGNLLDKVNKGMLENNQKVLL